MSAVSERARDFWDRISPRERGLVLLAAIAAPLTIVIWLGMAIGDGLSSMEARNDKMRKALLVVAEFPMTPSGKVQKYRLRELAAGARKGS